MDEVRIYKAALFISLAIYYYLMQERFCSVKLDQYRAKFINIWKFTLNFDNKHEFFKDVELHQIVKNVEKEILDTGFWI